MLLNFLFRYRIFLGLDYFYFKVRYEKDLLEGGERINDNLE